MRRLVAFFLCVCVLGGVAAEAAEKSRILMLTQSKGFMHDSVRRPEKTLSPAEIAMIQLGETSGLFTVDCTQDAELDFTKRTFRSMTWSCFTRPVLCRFLKTT